MSERTKMTIKVYSLLWDNFDAQIELLPVSRDRFLNNVLRAEVPLLSEAMANRKLSGKANRWISGQLKRLDTKLINIGLDKDIAHDLNEIVKKSHMVRDAFFNRLIAFLRSSDALLDYFGLPKREDGKVGKDYVNIAKPVSPLATLSETFSDPLWYLHMATNEIHNTSLYLLDFPSPKMDGFACWMDDSNVPHSKVNKIRERDLAEIVRSLGEFEAETLIPVEGGVTLGR
ncbi:MAG: hypothetical protein EXR07_11660 [Acetobacteraceae bacterium]|nr:hypothetical protein [Acetobacteraceae bacterium]